MPIHSASSRTVQTLLGSAFEKASTDAEDAFIRDVDAGLYFNPDRMHVLDHKGEFLKVRGPLNIARPIQGWPVIVQAGASEADRQLAAETAEVIFASGSSLVEAQRFYADVKSRAKKAG